MPSIRTQMKYFCPRSKIMLQIWNNNTVGRSLINEADHFDP